MKKKLFSFILAICLIIPCTLMLTACEFDKEDPTLYHLTLPSNITLDNTQKAQMKAIYGY